MECLFERMGFGPKPPPERELNPPEYDEVRVCCPECGAALHPGDALRREGLFSDILGCRECTDWVHASWISTPPQLCPNCGDAMDGETRVVITNSGLVLGCEICVEDTLCQTEL